MRCTKFGGLAKAGSIGAAHAKRRNEVEEGRAVASQTRRGCRARTFCGDDARYDGRDGGSIFIMLWLGADKTLLGFDARQFAQLLNDLFEELVLLLQFFKLRHLSHR